MSAPRRYVGPKGLTLGMFLDALRDRGWTSFFDHQGICHYRLYKPGTTYPPRGVISGPCASKASEKGDEDWTTFFQARPTRAVLAVIAELGFVEQEQPQ